MARDFRRAGYVKKEKLWLGIGSSNQAFTANATVVGTGITFSSPQTILRMIGGYRLGPTGDAAMVSLDRAEICVAIGVFSSDAFALGATAMPDPISEEGYPWLYWRNHQLFFPTTATDPNTRQASLSVDFDIRSMRKITANQTLGVVGQYMDNNGTPSLTWTMDAIRVLTTLH